MDKHLDRSSPWGSNWIIIVCNWQPYGARSSFSADLSLWNQLSEKLEIGLQLVNPNNGSKDQQGDEPYPQSIHLGVNYTPVEYLQTTLQLNKELGHNAFMGLGINYSFKTTRLRLGYSSEIDQFSFGFSWKNKFFLADLAASYHALFGFSPSISLAYELGKE